MTKWRPEGWQTLKPKHTVLHCLHPDSCVATAFEAGADAMLEALRKKGGHVTKEVYPLQGKWYLGLHPR